MLDDILGGRWGIIGDMKMIDLLKKNICRLSINPSEPNDGTRVIYNHESIKKAVSNIGQVRALSKSAREILHLLGEQGQTPFDDETYADIEKKISALDKQGGLILDALRQFNEERATAEDDTEDVPTQDPRWVFSNFGMLFSFAWDFSEKADRYGKLAHDVMVGSPPSGPKTEKKKGGWFSSPVDMRPVKAGIWRERERAALAASCLFSALALESAVNHCIERMADKRYIDQIPNMGLLEKWTKLPGIAGGAVTPEVIARIRAVYEMRHSVVHDKPVPVPYEAGEVDECGELVGPPHPPHPPLANELRDLESVKVVVDAVRNLMEIMPRDKRDLEVERPSVWFIPPPVKGP